jgi:hypothetical protein
VLSSAAALLDELSEQPAINFEREKQASFEERRVRVGARWILHINMDQKNFENVPVTSSRSIQPQIDANLNIPYFLDRLRCGPDRMRRL